MWIVEFKDYKQFLRALLKTYPKRGRGQGRKLAEHLGVAPIVISQILARDRHFTADQALKVAEFFGLEERATEYFIYLVSHSRADSKELRSFYSNKLAKLRAESQNLKNLVKGKEELSDADKGRFYSNWYYSGIRLLSSIEGYNTVDAIADYFGLSRAKAGEVVAFLVETGLCIEDEKGRIRMGRKSTHVSDKSEFVNNHRRNWRDKARERFSTQGPDDLFLSAPVSMSKKDAEAFRTELLKLIKNFSKQVEPSPEEILVCLNIDWFRF